MIPALLLMLGIGAACGIVLGLSSKIFYVCEDPRIALVEGSLAGANCGGSSTRSCPKNLPCPVRNVIAA